MRCWNRLESFFTAFTSLSCVWRRANAISFFVYFWWGERVTVTFWIEVMLLLGSKAVVCFYCQWLNQFWAFWMQCWTFQKVTSLWLRNCCFWKIKMKKQGWLSIMRNFLRIYDIRLISLIYQRTNVVRIW